MGFCANSWLLSWVTLVRQWFSFYEMPWTTWHLGDVIAYYFMFNAHHSSMKTTVAIECRVIICRLLWSPKQPIYIPMKLMYSPIGSDWRALVLYELVYSQLSPRGVNSVYFLNCSRHISLVMLSLFSLCQPSASGFQLWMMAVSDSEITWDASFCLSALLDF